MWCSPLVGLVSQHTSYVKAFIDAALRREDLAPQLRAHLKEIGWRAPGER